MEYVTMTPERAVITGMQFAMKGDFVDQKKASTREQLNVTLKVMFPDEIPFDVLGRKMVHKVAALETAGLIGQVPIDFAATIICKPMAEFQDVGIFYGGYGPRVRGQLLLAYQMLEDDPETRQAVVTIYHGPSDLQRHMKDIPCTQSFQFFIRNEKLSMRTVMRSNDIWLGLPYDMIMFCALQCSMAQWLGLGIGPYYHNVGSMHVYSRDFENVAGCLDKQTIDEPFQSADFEDTKYPWAEDTIDYAVDFCQAVLNGYPMSPRTGFEAYLVDSLKGLRL